MERLVWQQPSDSYIAPETARFQGSGAVWGCVLPGGAGSALCSHLHASAVHPDHLRPEGLDPAQDGLLVLWQRDPQADDISAKRAPCQPQKQALMVKCPDTDSSRARAAQVSD